MSDPERNKQVVRTSLEAADRGDLEAVRACFDPEYVDHSVDTGSRPGADREAAMQAFQELSRAFSGIRHTVLDLIAEGDRVVLRTTTTGTHQEVFRGIPPTGRTVTLTQTVIYRLREGRIVERWVDGPQSVVDQLRPAGPERKAVPPPAPVQAQIFRSDAVQWRPDASGGEFWEMRLNDVSLTCFRLEPGTRFPAHAHINEQITLVLQGRLAFELDQDRHVLGPGDAIAIPSGQPHAVAAGEEAVVAVDAWSPPPTHLGPPSQR